MPVIDFQFTDSPLLLLLAVLLLALLESLVVVGLLIPGVALLLSLTLMAVEAGLPLWLWCLLGALGAFTGDTISYELGKHQQQRIRHWRWFINHPDWLERGELFFRRYGVWSIALGRFIGPLRPLVPVVAGACNMARQRFYWVNAISSPVWAVAYLLPMFWLGEEALDYLSIGQLVLIMLTATLIATAISWLLKRS